MNYIFKTTATMKEYNNKKWYIDGGIVSDMRINADSVENALEIYRERVEEKHYITISKNAIKNKSEMFVDLSDGGASCYLVSPDTVQAFIQRVTWAQGVVNCFCNITVKPYKGRKYNPAFVWVCVG